MNGTCRVPPDRASGRGRIDSGSLGVARGHACPGRDFTDTDGGAQHNMYIHNYRYRRSLPSFPLDLLLHAFLDLLQEGRGRTRREIGNVSV